MHARRASALTDHVTAALAPPDNGNTHDRKLLAALLALSPARRAQLFAAATEHTATAKG